MAEATYILRTMKEDDFNEVHALWMSIHGFGIRSIDDSEENVKRFIRRNPDTSIVACMDGKIVGAILCGQDAFIMYASMRITGNMVLEKQWQ